ncbi:hypothetical protein DFH11DRAFT_1237953 [Phellopilus nigrolimitatus]|nr:hypothetical protein DFH11DRAFT_1237953 [Phellopilus nigrolimitatus]
MPFSLERSSLSALLPFFSAVPKGGGDLNTDLFWGKLVKEQSLTLDTSSVTHVARAGAIKSARMLQGKAVAILLTLQTLRWSLEEINATFKEHIDGMALRHGLDSLPDEILSQILGSVTSEFTEALRLSHVCLRFRQVTLDSSRIWENCRLDTIMNPRQIGALVDRKRNCPLKICIVGQIRCNNWCRRVETLFSLKDRIEDLEFRWLSVDDSKEISRQYNEFQMANLRKLTIQAYSSETSDFYALWSLPNLKCLWLTNFIPAPVFQQISYCRMRFTDNNWSLHYLSAFLRSLSSLETLEIELDNLTSNEVERYEEGYDGYDADNNYDDDSPWISNVASFSFSVIGRTLIPDAKRILEAIRLNVTELSLTIVYPKYHLYNSKVYWRQLYFLRLIRHFPMVEKLELHLSGPDPDPGLDPDYHLYFDEILFRVPRTLQNLRIEAPGHTLSMSGCDHTPPRLRTLQFRNCDRLNLQMLEDAHDGFLLNEVVIGKVEIVGCRLVEKEKLQDAFPNSEVVWKT